MTVTNMSIPSISQELRRSVRLAVPSTLVTWRAQERALPRAVVPDVRENKRHDSAWIVVRNRRGDERELFWTRVGEAEEKRRRVEHELEELPLGQWCERYGVPMSFVDPPSVGVLQGR